MKIIQKIAIIGAGAMGAFYAQKLYEMDKDCVYLIAGAERYEKLSSEGLTVNGIRYPLRIVTPEDKAVPPADLVIVAVKNHQITQAIADISNYVGESTQIISVMNGIDSEVQIGKVHGLDKVLYAVAVGIDAVREGTNVSYTKQGKLFFGKRENFELSESVLRLQELLHRAGIAYETPEDMNRILWWKFMINVGINQASAVLRAPYGVFQNVIYARDLMDSAMREVVQIAKARDIDISDEDVEDWYSFMYDLSPEGKTSMLQDVEAKRKTEVELFSGRMVELGNTYGIPVPVNQTFYRILKVMEREFGFE